MDLSQLGLYTEPIWTEILLPKLWTLAGWKSRLLLLKSNICQSSGDISFFSGAHHDESSES